MWRYRYGDDSGNGYRVGEVGKGRLGDEKDDCGSERGDGKGVEEGGEEWGDVGEGRGGYVVVGGVWE